MRQVVSSAKQRVRQAERDVWRLRHRRQLLPTVTFAELTGRDAPRDYLEAAIRDDMCLPPFVNGRIAGHNDFDPLMGVVDHLRPNVVVELGTAHGATVANICALYADCNVYTVNAPFAPGTADFEAYGLTAGEIGRVYRDHGFDERVTQILCDTLELDLGDYVGVGEVDLAIIDAAHDTPHVLNDFRRVEPYVRDGGIVMLHDTHPSMESHLVGSYKACVGLRRDGFDIRHLAGTWWGTWEKPTDSAGHA